MNQIERLLKLQEIDIRVRGMEQELKDIPARKDLELNRLQAHKQEVANADEALKSKQAEVKGLALEVEDRQGKISKLRQQQLLLKTNKEFKAIEHEIDALQAEISAVEDKELLLMVDIDAIKAEQDTKRADLKEEQAAVDRDMGQWDERAAGIEQRLQTELALRKQATEGIEPEWLSTYERVMTRRDSAVVAVKDGICQGCHLQLPPYLVHGTKREDTMIICGFCGRILY